MPNIDIHSVKLPAYAYEEMSSGEIINRITNDTETIVGSIDELMDIKGIGLAKAAQLKCICELSRRLAKPSGEKR